MCAHVEKRTSERHCFSADIAFSYFNNESSHNAQILNIGSGGMCFKSNLFLQPGATIIVRLEQIHPNGFCSGSCEGLRSVTLAEVKWCHEAPNVEALFYGVGVKYFEIGY
jgi:hypothetical protein